MTLYIALRTLPSLLTCTNKLSVTTQDVEVVEELNVQATYWGLKLRAEPAGKAKTYIFANPNGKLDGAKKNPLKKALKELGVLDCLSGDKFVPQQYKTGSFQNRLDLIAGLIDSDGYLNRSTYDYVTKSAKLAEDLRYILIHHLLTKSQENMAKPKKWCTRIEYQN